MPKDRLRVVVNEKDSKESSTEDASQRWNELYTEENVRAIALAQQKSPYYLSGGGCNW